MTLEFKDRDRLILDMINSISQKVSDIDFSDGEPLKTIIEAIVKELDFQYWQLGQVYDNSFIDTAYGEDLNNLVKLLGISRLEAAYSTGKVKFYRETPATLDYIIPAGTLVETIPNSSGEIIRFQVTTTTSLLAGQKEVFADVKSVEPGAASNVVANKVLIINSPPIGIESVVNTEAIVGGKDEETDENLRTRTVTVLESSGLGTVTAIKNKIASVSGVKSVSILDMARGIGTMDILVLGEVMPLPSEKITELNNLVQSIKACGIDFKIIEPAINTVNINATLTLKGDVVLNDIVHIVNKAIEDYIKSLSIGESFIKNQLAKQILNSSNAIVDIVISAPAGNINPGINSIIQLGTITLN